MPLCRHSVGTYQETSSHATHQEKLVQSHLSSLSHCGLIRGLKEWNWGAQTDLHLMGNDLSNLPSQSVYARKGHKYPANNT